LPSSAFEASSVTADVGTTTDSDFAFAATVTCAAPLTRRRPAPFSSVTQTSTVRLAGSTERLMSVTCPVICSPGKSVGCTVATSPVFNCAATVSAKGALTMTCVVSAMVTSVVPDAMKLPS
jgi:hypothetical protein